MVLTELGTWLRQQREARGWARREMAWRLIQAGREAGDTSIPGISAMYQNIRRWERGEIIPTERYRLCYCTALGIPPSQFGTTPPPQTSVEASTPILMGSPGSSVARAPTTNPAARNLADPHLLALIAVAYRGIHGSDIGDSVVEREVLMAAHEGSDHAEQAEQPGIGDITFEQLRADVMRLTSLLDSGEPFTAFLDMRRVRDRIYRLLDRRLWPREQTSLYFLLACLNGLMGIPANMLGYPDAAEELNRAGWAYAHAIDHRPLMAWLRGELSVYAYFRGRFEESRDLALSGLEYLSVGPQAAGLHIYYARAAGRLGDADAALQSVHDAHQARNQDYNDELLDIGGNFAISEATHYGLAGAALTATAGAEREAAEELEHAIGLYDRGPGEREEYWFGGKPLAGIDLAVVRLRSGSLDAAAAALEPTFSLPAAQRITDVTIRLAAARDELSAPVFRGSALARALGEQIEEFSRETIVAGLHSLPGGPG
jgi:transcriptional regulator with XRE-family HTH domain/tetratricopeptide (TPR) repeat protein